ncbi:MAG: o-succinylbenzoate synthase [Oscillatoriaceae cyanobacterium Prado104]|nr:o-succinylbenzoate synthase [Oscillatoriaceae cyanobacterium Prado104]
MLYQFQFRPYQRKFKRPLQTSHGIWEMREGIILQLTSENGKKSWGEIATLSWFGSESLEQALDFCQQLPRQISEEILFSIPAEFPACQFGFESAIWHELNSPPPAPPYQGGEQILRRYSGLLPAGETAILALQTLWQKGHRTFKWKIGVAAIDRELKMFDRLVRAMHKMGDREQLFLRLDANCGLNYQQTQTWLQACDRINLMPELFAKIEFLEQPLPVENFEEMLELDAAFATDIALDESAANLDRIQECYRRGWRGIFVIKPAIAGFPSQLQKFCQSCNIDAVFSSVFETQIGRQAALNLADIISPHSSRALGFGTDSWFEDHHSIVDCRL